MRNERGVTLIELLIAMLVFSFVLGGALSVFRTQSRGFAKGAERMTVLQNARFTANVLEIDLQTVGSGVPDDQPFIVYADEDVIAFNANYVTNVQSDVFAVYYDPDAPPGSVAAMTKAMRGPIPNATFQYPDTTYLTGGVNSLAETIVFFFRPDSSTPRGDDYGLFRKVNQDTPELVARNLLKPSGRPFLQYFREVTAIGGAKTIQQVPTAGLPLAHVVPAHGAAADTAAAAVIDSLRGMRINFLATNGKTGPAERTREISRLVRFPNAGIVSRKTCGDEPIGVPVFTVALDASNNVVLSWSQSIDEASGEQDVRRYVIWRRNAAVSTWGDPYLSIPSGNPSYVYVDAAVTSGDNLVYAVAAQDCTPQLSSVTTAGPIAIP